MSAAQRGQTQSGAADELGQFSSLARQSQARGDYRGAAASYREILKRQPELGEVRANLGLMHHLLGEYSEAIQQFEAALRTNRDLFVPNLFLGLDLLRLKQPSRAIKYLHRAQQLNPRDQQATLGLAQANAALRHFQLANDWYHRTKELNPKNGEAWYGLGVTYLHVQRERLRQLKNVDQNSGYSLVLLADSAAQQQRPSEAISLYRKAFATPPPGVCLHSALGFTYLQNGDFRAARSAFELDLQGKSNCLQAHLGLARLLIEEGGVAEALKEVTQAWEADSNFVFANAADLWLGLRPDKLDKLKALLAQSSVDDPEDSLPKALRRALERWLQDPSGISRFLLEVPTSRACCKQTTKTLDPAALFSKGHFTRCEQTLMPKLASLSAGDLLLLAQSAYYSGNYRGSYLASRKLVEASPGSSAGIYWLVKAAQKLGVSSLIRAGLAEPDSPRVHLLLAEANRGQHRNEEAKAEYQEAVRRKPGDLAPHLALATLYFEEFQFEKVIQELQRVFAIQPLDPEASYLMGKVLLSQQRYGDAIPYLNAALNGLPANLPHVHALLSKINAVQGRIAEAVTELKQALPADHDGSYHYQLYRLYLKTGDQNNAAAALEQSKTLRASNLRMELADFTK